VRHIARSVHPDPRARSARSANRSSARGIQFMPAHVSPERSGTMVRSGVTLLLCCACPALVRAQTPTAAQVERPAVQAGVLGGAIRLDGVLDDAAWAGATPATDFRQQDPHEGQPATQRTEVRFLYDDDALYIGARMFDDQAAAGVRARLGRRDEQVEGDYLMFVFDTFHDHTGRTTIQINPS